MAEVQELKPFILKWEGGFADDPLDRGGATNKGVTIATFKEFCKRKGYGIPDKQRLKGISEAEWLEILKTMYWDKWRADEIESQSVANILVDWVWASGVWGIKIPQRILGVKADGIVGKITLNAVNEQDARTFFNKIKEARKDFVHNIVARRPDQWRFLNGWLNRINNLNFVG